MELANGVVVREQGRTKRGPTEVGVVFTLPDGICFCYKVDFTRRKLSLFLFYYYLIYTSRAYAMMPVSVCL